MKSYLGLIPLRDKNGKDKNRLLLWCIILSVSLVTAIFSTAEMGLESQVNLQKKTYGDYHILLRNPNNEVVKEIGTREDIEYSGWMLQGGIGSILDKPIVFLGANKTTANKNSIFMIEGDYPIRNSEVLLSKSGMYELNKKINDEILIKISGSEKEFKITGIFEDTPQLQKSNICGSVMTEDSFKTNFPSQDEIDATYRIKFKDEVSIRDSIRDIKDLYGLNNEDISENTLLLGLMGASTNKMMQQFYILTLIVILLVLTAGSFMILSVFNLETLNNITYYGMLRCIGASRKQIKRLVILQGLYKGLKSIPIGLIIGQFVSWGICLLLKEINSNYFSEIPLFRLNINSIAVGIIVGIIMILISSLSPARKASKVAPIIAVKGLQDKVYDSKVKLLKNSSVEMSLGMRHALNRKKNIFLLTASFAICIILIFCFQGILDFFHNAMPVLHPSMADITITVDESDRGLRHEQINELEQLAGISTVYGNKEWKDFSVDGENIDYKLLSFDEQQFNWYLKDIVNGSIEEVKNKVGTVLVIKNNNKGYKIGDQPNIISKQGENKIEVVGIISNFRRNGIPVNNNYFICSEDTFNQLFGYQTYSYIGIKTNRNANDNLNTSIKDILGDNIKLSDFRNANSEQKDTYNTMAVFIYGFLTIVTIISFFNIFNSMNISVNTKLKKVGYLRAVGMSKSQCKKMILTESIIYVTSGFILGNIVGIGLHKILYNWLITDKWGIQWQWPITLIVFNTLLCGSATILSIIYPLKKVDQVSIVELIANN